MELLLLLHCNKQIITSYKQILISCITHFNTIPNTRTPNVSILDYNRDFFFVFTKNETLVSPNYRICSKLFQYFSSFHNCQNNAGDLVKFVRITHERTIQQRNISDLHKVERSCLCFMTICISLLCYSHITTTFDKYTSLSVVIN